MTNLVEAAQAAARAIDEKFGKDILVLDIKTLSSVADYFIIATAGNVNQMAAMADAAEEALIKNGINIRHAEGQKNSNWLLLDFGDIVLHIFDEEGRQFYNLERIWGDAASIEF